MRTSYVRWLSPEQERELDRRLAEQRRLMQYERRGVRRAA